MKKCVFQNLTIKFLIIVNLTFGSVVSAIAQDVSSESSFSLPFKQCWSYPIKMTNHNIASDNDSRIIIPTIEGKLLALVADSGIKLWETELGGKVVSDIIDDKESKNIYVATNSSPNVKGTNKNKRLVFSHGKSNPTIVKLRSLGKTTGITNWQTTLLTDAFNTQYKITVFVYNHKIITADQSGEITALSETDGEILWKKSLKLESDNTRFDLQDKNLIIISKNKAILADLETGERVFQTETDSMLTAVYLFNKTILTLGSKKGEILTIDTKINKTLWKFRAGAEISNISFTPKGLLVTSFDNFIYLVVPESGRVIWKRRLEGRIIIEPFLVDNYIIVETLGSSKAAILNLSEGKPVNQIHLLDNNYFVGRPVFNNRLVIFPTAEGLFAFTNSDNKCIAE